MKFLRMVGLAVIAVLMSVNLSSCKDDDSKSYPEHLFGIWKGSCTLSDGTVNEIEMDIEQGHCSYSETNSFKGIVRYVSVKQGDYETTDEYIKMNVSTYSYFDGSQWDTQKMSKTSEYFYYKLTEQGSLIVKQVDSCELYRQ